MRITLPHCVFLAAVAAAVVDVVDTRTMDELLNLQKIEELCRQLKERRDEEQMCKLDILLILFLSIYAIHMRYFKVITG